MVLFLDEKGEIPLKDIDYTVWVFQLLLLQNGKYVIAALHAHGKWPHWHEDCREFLERLRPDLKIREVKGAGVITVLPPSWSELPEVHLTTCLSLCKKEPDWDIVGQTLREEFPEAVVHHYIPDKVFK